MTVLVDDSASFLRSLQFQLDPALPSITCDDPRRALDWIRQHSAEAVTPDAFISQNFDTYPGSPQRCNNVLDTSQIAHISGLPRRFMTPSVVVVDYSMPQMSGVEFCEALHDLPCKKILLTGVADENVAIAAFNRGLIDRYIKKSDDDALDRLSDDILSLQREYFITQSDPLRPLLNQQEYGFASDQSIARLLSELSGRYGIVEHYLYQDPPGFLLYDGNAKPRLLIIETEQGMNAHFEVARDNGAPPQLLAALRERSIVPNFSGLDGMYAPSLNKTWSTYCVPARVCRGDALYYWGISEATLGVVHHSTASFSQFMRRHRTVCVEPV
jgi:CheY-like chemotaxis protein